MPPRRSPGDGTIYQRPDGRWVAQLEVGVPSGTRRRRTIYGRTRAEVARKLAEAQRARAAGDTTTSSVRLDAWLTYWLDQIAAPRLKPQTLRAYQSVITHYIVPSIGTVRLDKLTPAHVRRVHAHVESLGLSPTTAHHAHRVLSAALTDAVREGRVQRAVTQLVPAPRMAPPTRRALTADEATAVLRAADGDRLASLWMAALLSGARLGELLGLRWAHVNLDVGVVDLAWALQRVPWAHGCPGCGRTPARCPSRRVMIPRGMEYVQLGDSGQCLLRPKTSGSRRIVPLAAPLRQALSLRAMEAAEERTHMYDIDMDLVWCQPTGRPVDSRAAWRAWSDLLARAGVEHRTFHEARHTTATLLLEAGVPTEVISAILGHSEAVTTGRYMHVTDTLARAALDGVGQRLAIGG